MKPFLIGMASFLLAAMLYSFVHDYNLNRHALNELRLTCEEASAAGALFIQNEDYSRGQKLFNKTESLKAIDAVMQEILKLDEDMNPVMGSYWRDTVQYSAYFYDDSNTVYPYSFEDPSTGFTTLVTEPTVIVTINAGKARYAMTLLMNGPDTIRSAAHEWKER